MQKSCSNDDGFVAVGSVLPAVGCNRAYKYQWYACLHPCDRPVSQRAEHRPGIQGCSQLDGMEADS